MKPVIVALAVILAFASRAPAAEIADIAWTEPNIETLRAFDKAAVARLVTQVFGTRLDSEFAATDKSIGEFKWLDLAGDGQYQLVVALSNGRSFTNLMVYRHDASGTVSYQRLEGAFIPKLDEVVRDIDGDGKDELVVPIQFPPGAYWGAKPMAGWSVVYRLQNGTYVEASRDFPNFYDDEVLPQLQDQIKETHRQIATGLKGEAQLAVLEMSRDKILRMLGREPTAGLQKAREWANTDDPELLGDAIVVFRDIGGHEDELRAAELAGQRAMAAEKAARMGQ
jgi:hypothetical protein